MAAALGMYYIIMDNERRFEALNPKPYSIRKFLKIYDENLGTLLVFNAET